MTHLAQRITEYHRAAQSALQQGHLREAHQHCLAILKLDQTHADAWFLCGVIASHNGQTAKAVEIFRKAIKFAPANTELTPCSSPTRVPTASNCCAMTSQPLPFPTPDCQVTR